MQSRYLWAGAALVLGYLVGRRAVTRQLRTSGVTFYPTTGVGTEAPDAADLGPQ